MTGLPAARQLASLFAYHLSTRVWNCGQSSPSSVTLLAQSGSAACFRGSVAQQSYVTAVFHERYCAVVFSRLPGGVGSERRDVRNGVAVYQPQLINPQVGRCPEGVGRRADIKEEKRALEGAPSTHL